MLEKICPHELVRFAASHGVKLPTPEADDLGVGAMAPIMGGSWSVFLAHSSLADAPQQLGEEKAARSST